jgi:hypothetical protein
MDMTNRQGQSKHKHIILTSHQSGAGKQVIPIQWGAANPGDRGPIIGSIGSHAQRNVIGTHAGSYSVYRALAVASGVLDPDHRADLTNTSPVVHIDCVARSIWGNDGRGFCVLLC